MLLVGITEKKCFEQAKYFKKSKTVLNIKNLVLNLIVGLMIFGVNLPITCTENQT